MTACAASPRLSFEFALALITASTGLLLPARFIQVSGRALSLRLPLLALTMRSVLQILSVQASKTQWWLMSREETP
jgi:hypothetical protein